MPDSVANETVTGTEIVQTNGSPIKTEESTASNEADSSVDGQSEIPDDYVKLFEKYQEKFNKVYATSVELFEAEASQRQTLYYYQRRNNALLKVLESQDNSIHKVNSDNTERDLNRIEALAGRVPRLAKQLAQVSKILGDKAPEDFPVSQSHLINLFINESIPELLNDDLSSIEVNPQDINSWCRRNYPILVSSKFKPLYLPHEGVVNEYNGADLKLINTDVQSTPKTDAIPKRKLSDVTALSATIQAKKKVKVEPTTSV